MKQLRKYLETWVNGGHIRGITITSAVFYQLVDVYNAICREEKPEFIMQDVKDILDKCRIKTVEKGIGWKVV